MNFSLRTKCSCLAVGMIVAAQWPRLMQPDSVAAGQRDAEASEQHSEMAIGFKTTQESRAAFLDALELAQAAPRQSQESRPDLDQGDAVLGPSSEQAPPDTTSRADLAGLTLSTISSVGGRTLVAINGRWYREGDEIPGGWVIESVETTGQRVNLRHRRSSGRTAVLRIN